MPALAPDVAVVTYNSDYYLLNLLTSLERSRASSDLGAVHVWDNASSDRTADLLRGYAPHRPWLHVHRSDVNVHHGPALDALLRHVCRSEWVLLLDADTEITKPFGAALAALDLRDTAFVGQIHPEMPHLYAYLAHLLIHRARYLDLPPFRHHGAPGVDYFRSVERQQRPYIRFRWREYVHHFGQGSVRRVLERGERHHELYDFARKENERNPKTRERLERDRQLESRLQTFLTAPMAATTGQTETGKLPTVQARRKRWKPDVEGLGLWFRAPRRARWLHAARRIGLVQRPGEILDLLRLVEALRPARVVEIGTGHGGTFLLWARAAAPDARLVSIDRPPWELDDPGELPKTRALERVGSARQSIHLIRGSSHDRDVRARAAHDLAGGPVDFLFIDGDHSFDGVTRDFHDYAGWVRPGGIVALHDIHPHSKGWGGDVPAFWREIRNRHRHAELIANPDQDGFGIGVIWV